MISKKLLGLVTSVFLLFNVAGPTGVKTTKTLDANVQNVGQTVMPKDNYLNGGPYDLAIANEDKIIEMLKREGKIAKNATPEQIQKAYSEYMAKVAKSQNEMASDVNMMDKSLKAMYASQLANYQAPKSNTKVTTKSSGLGEVQEQQWDGSVRKDRVMVLLVDFPDFPHNSIDPQKDAPVIYYNDYTNKHYEDMLFGDNRYAGPNGETFLSMKQFYEQQSGGSYTVEGKVFGWYSAVNNAAYYGAHNGSSNDARPRELIVEALTKAAQDPAVQALPGGLGWFDQEDPYDLDHDGNRREPDGIIDHIITIHAGIGEEAGGGALGEDAIWSHSWNQVQPVKISGTNFYTYDYTVEPEDGAAGVFAHEYGHDLGLPDEYDTIYSGPGEAIGFWSVMSSGSWGGIIPETEPTGFSPYAKQFFQATMPGSNWQPNVETINYADLTTQGKSVILDQASSHGLNKNVVRINLPDKQLTYTTPFGQYAYYGGKGTDGKPWNKSMTAQIDLTGKTSAELNFKTWYDIEEGWDFAYIEAKEQGTDTWTVLEGNITTTEHDPDADVVVPYGITGSSEGKWVDAIFNLSSFAGKKVDLRVHYQCDSYSYGQGFFIDNIVVKADDEIKLTDNAEDATSSFDLTGGFTKNDGKSRPFSNYYLVEWRNQQGVDTSLAHVNRGGQMLSYDPGMVVWYVDTAYSDNWTGVHPGEGYLGVVDADQTPLIWNYKDGRKVISSNSYEMHDAAFSLRKSAPFYLDQTSLYGRTLSDNNQFMHPFFDDSRSYTNPDAGFVGRNVPKLGVKIYVTGENKDRSSASILIKK